jgi:ribosomal protein S18 acetylase RimI-like enzyme
MSQPNHRHTPLSAEYRMREATRADIDTLLAFTLQEVYEAEGTHKDAAGVRRGVEGAFQNPPRSAYWIVESLDGRPVASTSIVTEWSDFHGGEYWWIQSLFITPEHRGRGLVDLMLDRLTVMANAAGALELRLYAHNSNARAFHVYRRCGFTDAPYTILARKLDG